MILIKQFINIFYSWNNHSIEAVLYRDAEPLVYLLQFDVEMLWLIEGMRQVLVR